MNQADFVVLFSSAISFIFFLIAHALALRTFKNSPAPLSIMSSIALGFALNLLLFVSLSKESIEFSFVGRLFSMAVSMIIYLFLVLHYLAFVFGMGEASIRIRLLFEADQPEGVTAEQILGHYNADQILKTRLSRLITAGHFKFDGTYYEVKSPILLIQLKLIHFFNLFLGIQSKIK